MYVYQCTLKVRDPSHSGALNLYSAFPKRTANLDEKKWFILCDL